MTSILTVSPSPHVRSSMTTQKIMLLVVLALVPAIVAATVVFGPRALLLVVFCAVVSMFTELVCQKMMQKEVTVSDGSAMLTGVLLAGCAADTADANADLPVITVGCDNYPPFTYVNSDGKPVGIDVELADEAFRRMGYRPEFVTINWAEKNTLLENGVIDCIWSSFSMSGRADEYTWAGPYMYSHQVVAVMPDSDIQTLADLAGKTVVVQATTKPESLFLDGNDPRIPEIRALHSLQKRELIYSYLAKGYADAVAAHEISILQFMKDYGFEFRILEEPLEAVELGVAFSRSDDRGIAQALSATLEEMHTDGTTRSILAGYLADPDKYLEADGYAD